MKNLFLTCFLLSRFAENISAQAITFQKSFAAGGYTIGRCVRQTNDGGYIFTGYAEVLGAGIQDVYLVKTNADGDTLWTKTYGGSQYDDGFCVEQTNDEGYIIAGYTSSFGAGAEDIYLIKTNAMGDTLWTKTYGGTNNDRAASVVQTVDGGYIIAGETISYGAANHDVYVIKTNAVGDIEWTKVMGTGADNYGYDVIETTDGNFMLSGGHGPGGAYLAKLNTVGDSLWTKGYIAEGPPHLNNAQAVKQTTDGGFVFTGIAYGATGIQSYLQKTNVAGDTIWAKKYSGVNHVYTTDIDITNDGGYILSGWSQAFPNGTYKSILIKTDAVGDTLWTKKFIGGGSYSSVQQTMDGGYILLSADNFNIYLTKTDADGNTGCNDANAWPVVTDAMPSVSVPVVALTTGGDAYYTTTQIEFGGTITSLCYECNLDVTLNELPDTVCLNGVNWPLVGNPADGVFSGPGVSNYTFYPAEAGVGLHEIFYTYSYSDACGASDSVTVFVDECVGVNEWNDENSFSIYPNPAKEFIVINTHEQLSGNIQLRIFDAIGNEIYATLFFTATCSLMTANFPSGIYFCQVMKGDSVVSKKFVVER